MSKFVGNPCNVSPLCQGCSNILLADKYGYDNHQCEECKNTEDEAVKEHLKHELNPMEPKEEQFVELKTKEERRKDIQGEMVRCMAEKQKLTIEFRQRIKSIDDKYNELDYKLMTGNY